MQHRHWRTCPGGPKPRLEKIYSHPSRIFLAWANPVHLGFNCPFFCCALLELANATLWSAPQNFKAQTLRCTPARHRALVAESLATQDDSECGDGSAASFGVAANATKREVVAVRQLCSPALRGSPAILGRVLMSEFESRRTVRRQGSL